MRNRLIKRLVEPRNKLVFEAWQKYKATYSLSDIAMMFKIPLELAWKIIKFYSNK